MLDGHTLILTEPMLQFFQDIQMLRHDWYMIQNKITYELQLKEQQRQAHTLAYRESVTALILTLLHEQLDKMQVKVKQRPKIDISVYVEATDLIVIIDTVQPKFSKEKLLHYFTVKENLSPTMVRTIH